MDLEKKFDMKSFIRNPEEKEKDPIPIYFEMNNCNLTCPKLPDLMLAQSFLGLEVTYESMVCGQIGLKHCKVWPGQRKMELVRVNTNVTGNKTLYKVTGLQI